MILDVVSHLELNILKLISICNIFQNLVVNLAQEELVALLGFSELLECIFVNELEVQLLSIVGLMGVP